jgi:hypothetical protein
MSPTEEGNRPSFRKFVFSTYSEFRTMHKIHRLSDSEQSHVHLIGLKMLERIMNANLPEYKVRVIIASRVSVVCATEF